MLIGLDFDNTIVCYDKVFHTVAVEKGYIDKSVPASKVIVRDTMRQQSQEEDWTEMQGYVYGCRMELANPFVGAIEFIHWAKNYNHECSIISHKTKKSYLGHP